MTCKQAQSDRPSHVRRVTFTPGVFISRNHHAYLPSGHPRSTHTQVIVLFSSSSSPPPPPSASNNQTATFGVWVSVWKRLSLLHFFRWNNNTSHRFLSQRHGTLDDDQIVVEACVRYTRHAATQGDLNWSNLPGHLVLYALSASLFSRRNSISIWICWPFTWTSCQVDLSETNKKFSHGKLSERGRRQSSVTFDIFTSLDSYLSFYLAIEINQVESPLSLETQVTLTSPSALLLLLLPALVRFFPMNTQIKCKRNENEQTLSWSLHEITLNTEAVD